MAEAVETIHYMLHMLLYASATISLTYREPIVIPPEGLPHFRENCFPQFRNLQTIENKLGLKKKGLIDRLVPHTNKHHFHCSHPATYPPQIRTVL